MALHEAGHVHDFASRRFKGTYASIRIIPFVDLYQEYKASAEAIGYLKEIHDHSAELDAYKVLYPAYGTYVGSYLFPLIGSAAGALLGHVVGRSASALRKRASDGPAEERNDIPPHQPFEPKDASPSPAVP